MPEATAYHGHDVQLPASKRLNGFVLLALSGVFLASFILPAPDGDYFTICAFKNLTGLPCPGCGLTHSFCALVRGHLAQAFEYNILGPAVFLFSVLAWIRSALVLAGWYRQALAMDLFAKGFRIAWAFVAVFVVFGVGRIVYLLISRPDLLNSSPVARLLAWITH